MRRAAFLVTDHGPVVVDVKPEHLLARPKVTCTFEWTRRLVEARGWRSGNCCCRTGLTWEPPVTLLDGLSLPRDPRAHLRPGKYEVKSTSRLFLEPLSAQFRPRSSLG